MAVLLITAQGSARELYNRNISVRALGMGNAFTAIARNTDALFYNPAGIAKTEEVQLTLLKAKVGVNGVDAYEKALDLDSDNLADTLREFYGEHLWMGGGAVVGFSMPYFAAAVYDSFNVSADLSNPALPSFQVDFVNDYGIATGLGVDLAKGLSVGIVAKRINRIGSSAEISVESLANLNSDDLKDELDNRGLGYSLDAGIAMTFPTAVKPTLAVVMQNIGDTTFSLDRGLKRPPTDTQQIIASASLEIEAPGMVVTPVFEMKHIDSSEQIHAGKKFHAGVEVDLPGLALRGGFHQGYYTAGVGLNLGVVSLDFATYGVELGQYPGQHEDRRYIMEMTIDFGFNPSTGSFLGTTSKSRRNLKQRR